VQTCHKGAPVRPKQTVSVEGMCCRPARTPKIQLAMLGGLISREYWILDHPTKNGWLIMTTADGRYVWLMFAPAGDPRGGQGGAVGRMQQLGLNLTA